MQPLSVPGFSIRHPLLYRFLLLSGITLVVYLCFRYLLGMIFPFLFSFAMMRLLQPVMRYAHKRLRLPKWLAAGGTLTLFFLILYGSLAALVWQLVLQLRLLLVKLPLYQQQWEHFYHIRMSKLCQRADRLLHWSDGRMLKLVMAQTDQTWEKTIHFLSKHVGDMLSFSVSISVQIFTIALLIVVSMAALCQDIKVIQRVYRRSPFFVPIHRVAVILKCSGIAYLKSQGIILVVIWSLCAIGLALIRNPYSILLGGCIALFDTLPVLGSGMILVPWALVLLIGGRYPEAVLLLLLFVVCAVARDILEAHLMGNHMGLLPFAMTAMLYIGVCLFGVWGIVLGPFGAVLVRAIYEQMV